MYDIANRRVIGKTLPLHDATSRRRRCGRRWRPQTRSPPSRSIDELAYAAKMDPVAFRLQEHRDRTRPLAATCSTRRRAGCELAAEGLRPRTCRTRTSSPGRGFGARQLRDTSQSGAVADIEVNKKTGKITVKHIYAAHVRRPRVNPELVENQMIGAAIMGTSRALHEAGRFNEERRDEPRLGHATRSSASRTTRRSRRSSCSGSTSPPRGRRRAADRRRSAGAIANAFFDATGVRIREAPMTPAGVRGTLKRGS